MSDRSDDGVVVERRESAAAGQQSLIRRFPWLFKFVVVYVLTLLLGFVVTAMEKADLFTGSRVFALLDGMLFWAILVGVLFGVLLLFLTWISDGQIVEFFPFLPSIISAPIMGIILGLMTWAFLISVTEPAKPDLSWQERIFGGGEEAGQPAQAGNQTETDKPWWQIWK